MLFFLAKAQRLAKQSSRATEVEIEQLLPRYLHLFPERAKQIGALRREIEGKGDAS